MKRIGLGLVVLLSLSGVARAAEVNPGDCWWALKTSADTANVAYPDEDAQYYTGAFEAVPGAQMTIRGRFPLARYMSFHLYVGSMPAQALADNEIVADAGTNNPFLDGASHTDLGTYTISVVFGPRPAIPAPNTLYAVGLNGEPLVSGAIIYRIYVPEVDAEGGVPLPTVTLTGGPEAAPVDLGGASCEPARNLPEVSDQLRDMSIPADSPAGDDVTVGTWKVTHGDAQTVGNTGVKTTNAAFANLHNNYLGLLATRDTGDVLVIRARVPNTPVTTGATIMDDHQELRYYSICQNDRGSTRYTACLSDENIATTVTEGARWATVVISDVAHKPATLRPTDNWIPAGPYPDFFVLYRHMLANGFPRSIGDVPGGNNASDEEIRASMGDYYPEAHSCTVARFDADRCAIGD